MAVEIVVTPPKCPGLNGRIQLIGPFGGVGPYEITYFNQPIEQGQLADCTDIYIGIPVQFSAVCPGTTHGNIISPEGACLFRDASMNCTSLAVICASYYNGYLSLFLNNLNNFLTFAGYPAASYVDVGGDKIIFYVPRAYWGSCAASLVDYGGAVNIDQAILDIGDLACCPSPFVSLDDIGPVPPDGWSGANPPNGFNFVSTTMGLTPFIGTPGKYLIQIKDANGQFGYVIVEIPNAIKLPCVSAVVKHESCFGANDGSIDFIGYSNQFTKKIVGSTWRYYAVCCEGTGVSMGNTLSIRSLTPGTYCLDITAIDETNLSTCTETCCFSILTAVEIEISSIIEQPLCASCGDTGRAILTISGGTTTCKTCDIGAYKVSVDGSSFVDVGITNVFTVEGLVVGTHKIIVQDCNCCIKVLDIVINDNNFSIEV